MAVCPGRDINYSIYGNLNLSKIQKTPRLAAPSPGVLEQLGWNGWAAEGQQEIQRPGLLPGVNFPPSINTRAQGKEGPKDSEDWPQRQTLSESRRKGTRHQALLGGENKMMYTNGWQSILQIIWLACTQNQQRSVLFH